MDELSTDSGVPRPSILVVDDIHANRVAMRRLLAQVDAKIVEAASGTEALAACLETQFALILLDVQMPDMDGFEVAELLSGQGELSETPVIFVTANYTAELDALQGYELGAVDYLTKPVNETVLLAKVRAFLELYRTRGRLQQLLGQMEAYNRRLQAEIAERKQAEARALHRAYHDPLTDLPNRARFYEQLETALVEDAAAIGLVFIDLDGFKALNDGHGHAAGDALLVAVAGRLLGAFRREDVVARLGGDEFAVLLVGLPADQPELPHRLAETVIDKLSRPFALELAEVSLEARIGASVGVALGARDGGSADALVAAADAAMYRAKAAGKGRVMMAGDDAPWLPGQSSR